MLKTCGNVSCFSQGQVIVFGAALPPSGRSINTAKLTIMMSG